MADDGIPFVVSCSDAKQRGNNGGSRDAEVGGNLSCGTDVSAPNSSILLLNTRYVVCVEESRLESLVSIS